MDAFYLDDYGNDWTYRVFSTMNTEPDTVETGQRCLTIHRVCWHYAPCDWPIHDDVVAISAKPVIPCGGTTEELMMDLARMQIAIDQPVLIRAEWQKFFDRASGRKQMSRDHDQTKV